MYKYLLLVLSRYILLRFIPIYLGRHDVGTFTFRPPTTCQTTNKVVTLAGNHQTLIVVNTNIQVQVES